MSSCPNSTIFASPISAVAQSFKLAEGLPFADVLGEKDIRKAFDDAECHFAEKTERKIKKNLSIHNRENFLLVDGSDITGSDTPDNQEEYPQPESQAEGCAAYNKYGPMMRVLILTSLITGMVRAAAMTAYSGKETGEGALLRSVIGQIEKGSVIVGDREGRLEPRAVKRRRRRILA